MVGISSAQEHTAFVAPHTSWFPTVPADPDHVRSVVLVSRAAWE